MKLLPVGLLLALAIFAVSSPCFGTVRYVSPNGTAVSPYTDWGTAATNIQDAIDASSADDVVMVTNGVYSGGGQIMDGDLVSRVALYQPLTVQSVNGPLVTTIQGAWDPSTTNGPLAVRCAWLTNGASLIGFTLQGGATLLTSTTQTAEVAGAAFCNSSSAILANCIIRSNAAAAYASGVYEGTLNNCALMGNVALSSGILPAAAYAGSWNNCTVVGNVPYGLAYGTVMNCVVYSNAPHNYSGGTWSHCCTTPAAGGVGNITSPPLLLSDGIHLANGSPCLGAGTTPATATDMFGQPWANPPSMGCAEWQPSPVVSAPAIHIGASQGGFVISTLVEGEAPLAFTWLHDGAAVGNDGHYSSAYTAALTVDSVLASDAGTYRAVVSNALGTATSAVTEVVIHLVDAGSTAPVSPYLSWPTAATNIQDAINAANPGEIILVTNGLYAYGGAVMDSNLTSRVALNKPVLVQSLNGAAATIIQGAWDPSSVFGPGPLAVRCAWLTNGAALVGFTLQSGSTRVSATSAGEGGGAWCSSSTALLANCLICSNSAYYGGSAVLQGAANACAVIGNNSGTTNFTVPCVEQMTLNNCTIFANVGGGTYAGALTNCIICSNTPANYSVGTLAYCCTTPLPSGPGNLSAAPQFTPGTFQLAYGSPCIAAGTTPATATDLFGQPWANPPCLGCVQWSPLPVVFPPTVQFASSPPGFTLTAATTGQPPFDYFWLQNGAPIENDGHYNSVTTTQLVVVGINGTEGGAYQLVASNAFGVTTSAVTQVAVHFVNAASAAPAAPYSSWATAAVQIQDAVDAAAANDIILVTNGVYATGGRAVTGTLTNRVAVPAPMMLIGMNGAAQTIIQGAWDPVSTNGPLAVRCVYLAAGASLQGFTLTGGGTQSSGVGALLEGGGVLGSGTNTNAVVASCIISNNAGGWGAGCAQVQLVQCQLLQNLGGTGLGGGAYQSLLVNCIVRTNSADEGGGLYDGAAYGSLFEGNAASVFGGGAAYANLYNCTVIYNQAGGTGGGGIYSTLAVNSIIENNDLLFYGIMGTLEEFSDCYSCTLAYSCIGMPAYGPPPFISGTNYILVLAQFLDDFYLATTSPCRGAGSALFASGTDINGLPWANPPSMGCSEVWPATRTGPLAVSAAAYYPSLMQFQMEFLSGSVSGQVNQVTWSYGDGTALTKSCYLSVDHVWTNAGDYTVTFTAFNADYPAGVSTNITVHVLPVVPPTLVTGPPAASGGTNFTMSFAAQGYVQYVVQWATNLAPPVAWQTLSTPYPATNCVIQVSDPISTNGLRFYRVTTSYLPNPGWDED